jgi:hypothetical protein
MTNEEWQIAKPLLQEYFKINGDEWIHHRIERDLIAVNSKSGKASEAGKASAARRAAIKAEKDSTNVQQTFNHTDVDTDVDKPKTLVVSELTPCPHSEIISLYAELLPELPQVRKWEGTRARHLKARWAWVLADLKSKGKPFDKASGLDFFRRMFGYIAKSNFLMGRSGGFSCTLPWIVMDENFTKIIEGNYENKAQA